jgi:MFS family permease
MAAASLLSVLLIPGTVINHDAARGLDAAAQGSQTALTHGRPSGWTILAGCRPLLIFAVCVTLLHFANAAMLPLVGQQLASQNQKLGTTLMSVCIIAAQVVMLPMALLVGAKADRWGRKPLFLIGLFILPVRAVLYTLSDNPFWLMSVQLLDGVGAGIFGALFPVIVADITRGTGHFNFAQGTINTAAGIGAALSTSLAGIVAAHGGYHWAFLTLGAVAFAALALFSAAMPETRGWKD